MTGRSHPALVVQGLSVAYPGRGGGAVPALWDVGFSVAAGEAVGVVGASGSGKSTLAAALIGLLPPPGQVTAGLVSIDGSAIAADDEGAWARVRGRRIGLVFQDAARALDPLYTVRSHLLEAGIAHGTVEAALASVGLPTALSTRYPQELSGGQQQRVMIVMALARRPPLLIADEPTASLDTVSQLTVLHALQSARQQTGAALLLITHDLGVVSRMVDRLIVLEAGAIVETGPVAQLLSTPQHPATRALLEAQR